ncbi:MAG: hypothetical protein IKQ39_02325 [Oscillospiraceae bacterium]|nr:hypothetical protein [Oscillospiraceae bacterium]
MKMTSAQAAKLLRKLNDELRTLQVREENTRSFIAALQEDPETVRPAYNLAEMRSAQSELELKIRKVKHAINVFNTVTVVPGFGITIDELLVYLPQLSRQYNLLCGMKDALPKVRENTGYSRSGSVIDYRYANYDIAEAGKYYNEISEKLAEAQTALDLINNTVEFDVNI